MSASDTLLYTSSDWDWDTLSRIDDACREIAINEMGLSVYPNQMEIITAEQMLDAYSSVGMPQFYKHWSFGKHFAQSEKAYKTGMQGLAYEIVINSSPCIAYLMEGNTATMQTLVIAHAAYGHNHFFKNNHLFKEWTDAEGILDYLSFAKEYIAKCEERYGVTAVEMTVDAAHALQTHAVHRYLGKKTMSLKESEERAKRRRQEAQANFNDLWRTIPASLSKPERDQALEQRRTRLGMPQENLLYFLEKYAPRLQPWQREILRIVRKVAQYFYPQGQTKVMNEGCATYVHYRIMKRLHEKGMISDGNYLEFIHSHTSVVFQPEFDDPRYSGFNPYALGFTMMMDIERIANGRDEFGVPLTDEQKEEDREWFKDQDWYKTFAGTGDSMGALKYAWANFRDESFIAQFLSPLVMRKMRMFHLHDDPANTEGIEVAKIHNDRGYRDVRRALAKSYEDGNRRPNIEIVDVNLEGERRLDLVHTVYSGRELDEKTASQVLQYLSDLWSYPVSLSEDGGTRTTRSGTPREDVLKLWELSAYV